MTTESVAMMEPMMPAIGHKSLEDLAMGLAQSGAALTRSLHPLVLESIGDLVRSMNCYYSNLIEGHDTHPRDIEKALAGDFSADPEKRNLQLEARAHIDVQRAIDRGQAPELVPMRAFILWLHREFCSKLPAELLLAENPDTGEKIPVEPGRIRSSDVAVGRHIPPSAENLERFLERFEEAYNPGRLSLVQQVIAIAASHHRLVWIHPFLDGNGRVARLHSHTWLLRTGIGSSLWSVARGLARNRENYKAHLMAADGPRKSDLDGRGNLSHEELVRFCEFFLRACQDQINYMAGLLDIGNLVTRMSRHVQEEIDMNRLPMGSLSLLKEALYTGEFRRGRAAELTGYQERKARMILTELRLKGYLISDNDRGPLRLGFPADAVERWLPNLYPAADG